MMILMKIIVGRGVKTNQLIKKLFIFYKLIIFFGIINMIGLRIYGSYYVNINMDVPNQIMKLRSRRKKASSLPNRKQSGKMF